ncbi:UNVERIFIED_CONTAM: hypothetical protein RMT77_000864 [Armadillidium vulgare]
MIMGSSAKDTKSSIQQYDTKVPTSVPGAEVRDVDGDSSESDGETEPAKSFHRRISTNKEIKCSVSTKEGYLMKQTSSFQRWRRRYFKLKGRKLYYAKDTKSVIFDDIDLRDLSVAECSTKNVNHSFQCITPFRVLILAAETRRDMEEWIGALKSAATNQYYEGMDHLHSLLSGQHNWYATSHARPTYCNICREALSGVTSHGLSCEVCKMKSHKRCAVKALNNCKWTTLSSVGKEIIEEDDGSLTMPHQWLEGNLPVSAKCAVCEKTCGSVRRLQDWRCLWCRTMVHTACRPLHPVRCPLGPCRVSIVPPTTLTTIGTDESWEATRPQGCSPLLVFVNSKSGDNQGVRFLRRFKQLLNPAQVFDLMNGGPVLGLRLFKCFNPFRILICSGDGSVGWVLSEVDNLNMTNQCQMGVLPLGTGNDLARVLGWGSSCDDDAHLPQIIEKYERATTKMLDRWSIMTFVSHMPVEPHHKMDPDVPDTFLNQVSRYENSVANHVVTLLQSDQHSEVIASAKVICETVKSLIVKVGGLNGEAILNREGKDSLTCKCEILNDKLDLLLRALHQESMARPSITSLSIGIPCIPPIAQEEDSIIEESSDSNEMEGTRRASVDKDEKYPPIPFRRRLKSKCFIEKEAVMSRANSLKKAVRQIIEMTEKALDEQNAQSHLASGHLPQITLQCPDDPTSHELKDSPSIEGPSPAYLSPYLSTLTTNFPLAPASPILHPRGSIGQTSVLGVPPPPSSLQIPTQISPPRSPIPGSDIHYLSPLPNVRRESECEAFDFPPTLPVPSMFADLEREKEARRDSFLQIESQSRRESSSLNPEDVEIRIQSSTDDLLTVGDDEPFAFEEKSISEIRDSMASAATSLDTSFDAEDLEDEEVEEEKDKEEKLLVKRGEREPPDGGVKEEESVGGGNSGDSEDTDDTVKEKAEDSENGAQLSPLPEQEVNQGEIIFVIDDDESSHPTQPSQIEIEKESKLSVSSESDRQKDELEFPSSAFLSIPTERIVEGAEAGADDERAGRAFPSPATRRVSTGAALKICGSPINLGGSGRDKSRSPERSGRAMGGSTSNKLVRKHLPIINPLVMLPTWPNIAAGGSTGGLVSKVLLANADALCAAASPLMDIDESSLEGFSERCIMNNYFGIGIDAKITLDFHNKREEHPEKCRSRTKNFMWYGVLASKEWLCKTYKNLDQRVQLECDGERIPLPSLQGIVILNIPSFMGGTNFWGGTKEDDCFIAPSFDDRILEVVAVFGSAQMAASRIINLQHHRIAQCSTVKITILGEEALPIQVDGEAWAQPPGIIRIIHKNRVQMLCRNRELEVSLKAWEEKLQSQGRQTKQPSLLTDEEIHCLTSLANVVCELLRNVRVAASTSPNVEQQLTEMALNSQSRLDKVWRDSRVIEGPNLRMLATELVTCIRSMQTDISTMIKESSLVMTASQENNLCTALAHLDSELKKAHEKDHLVHFEEEAVPPPQDRKRSLSKGTLFKLKLKREALRARGGQEGQVREWSPEEVANWLSKLGLAEHKEAFVNNDIRGAELLSLDRRDLKELGVIKIGHIKRIQQAVRDIKDNKAILP